MALKVLQHLWQQGVTSSVFQDRHRYLVNADVFAEVIDFIISMSVKYYAIWVFSHLRFPHFLAN